MPNIALENPVLSGRRILIVEDEMLLALDLQLILEDQGCVILGPVPNAQRAIELMSEERPDAATLDLNLDGKSSLPVANALVERDIPYLIISGYSNRTESEPPLRDAPRVGKPVDAAALLSKLGALLTP